MRVGIVGGGVAGLTLAGKLLQQGRTPVVIEQERGEVAEAYEVVNGHGERLQDVDLSQFAGDIGPMVLLSRTDLIEILHSAANGADIRMGTGRGSSSASTRRPSG